MRKRGRGVRRGYREVIGRRARSIVALLDEQLDAATQGTELALTMVHGEIERSEARTQIGAIEHIGDDSRTKLVGVLIGTLVTPIDREDLYRLSRSIDDILDGVRDFVRESDLYVVSDQAQFVDCLNPVLEGIKELQSAIRVLAFNARKATRHALGCRRSANQVRAAFQRGLAALFEGELTMETLRVMELYRRLDVVAMRLDEAADALSDGLLKRQYSQ